VTSRCARSIDVRPIDVGDQALLLRFGHERHLTFALAAGVCRAGDGQYPSSGPQWQVWRSGSADGTLA
jgi:hypothetical protein